MAYGKNKERKGWLIRAVPLAIGEISGAKRARVFQLRTQVLSLMREMAQAGFSPDPLDDDCRGKDLDARLLDVQKDCVGLNSVWREQARMRVKPALEEAVKRYFKRLAGSLRFVDEAIPPAERSPESVRRFFNVPESVQDLITPAELDELKTMARAGRAIEVFRQWHAGIRVFTPAQTAVLAYIHERALARHTLPDFGAQDEFTLQLHLDARMLPQGKGSEALALREGASVILCDEDNALYYRFLDIAGLSPREERIRLPLAVTGKIAKRLNGARADWAALILEISTHAIGVRLVAGQPPRTMPTEINAFVGRDFGYANTVSLSVAMADEPIDLDAVNTALERLDAKDSVRTFLETHALPGQVSIVERVRFDGRAFLARVSTLCTRIDALKSRIDLGYNDLEALRTTLGVDLGLGPEERITTQMKKAHPAVRAFFTQLGRINDLKRVRRALYRKIAALKEAWFGFLSNVEIALARRYNAALVREDLSVQAIEKESPVYKGRTFNKMLNNGSKGQYQRRTTDKMLWNGVPEIVVPAWYTSRACLKHATIVAKHHRRGEQIFLPCCNQHDHADEHAADTIASYPFLRPRLTPKAQPPQEFVTPASPAPFLALGSSGL